MYYWPFAVEHDTAVAICPFYGNSPAEIHAHHYSELCIIQKGFCVHTYKDVDLILIPGDAFIIPSGEAHKYSWMADMSVINCHFYEDKIRPESRRIFDQIIDWIHDIPEEIGSVGLRKQGIIHFNSEEMEEIVDLMMRIKEEDEPKPLSEILKLAYLDILLCSFRRTQMVQSRDRVISANVKSYNTIAKGIRVLEENLSEDVDLDMLASNLGLSTSHFRKLFRDVTGLPPNSYINRLRITKSLELLNNTDKTIAEIAEQLGICDANYFARMFKKYIGYSPQNYRKKLKSANS